MKEKILSYILAGAFLIPFLFKSYVPSQWGTGGGAGKADITTESKTLYISTTVDNGVDTFDTWQEGIDALPFLIAHNCTLKAAGSGTWADTGDVSYLAGILICKIIKEPASLVLFGDTVTPTNIVISNPNHKYGFLISENRGKVEVMGLYIKKQEKCIRVIASGYVKFYKCRIDSNSLSAGFAGLAADCISSDNVWFERCTFRKAGITSEGGRVVAMYNDMDGKNQAGNALRGDVGGNIVSQYNHISNYWVGIDLGCGAIIESKYDSTTGTTNGCYGLDARLLSEALIRGFGLTGATANTHTATGGAIETF